MEDTPTLLNKKKKRDAIRDNRRNQYDELSKKYPKIDISELSVSDFLQARTGELANFKKILSSKFSTKSGFQLLPKHMRRRAASHNPYRIPSRQRPFFKDLPNKSRCAKHKLKGRARRLSLFNRGIKNGWLEGHLYYSRRFHMTDYYGYKIPLNKNDKSLRACYRYFQNTSVATDLSYFCLYLLEPDTLLIDNLSNQFGQLLIRYTTGKLIGPAMGLEVEGKVLILVDPAVETEIDKQGHFTKFHLNLFELFGKTAEKVIS